MKVAVTSRRGWDTYSDLNVVKTAWGVIQVARDRVQFWDFKMMGTIRSISVKRGNYLNTKTALGLFCQVVGDLFSC
jgi:hypothetical protein